MTVGELKIPILTPVLIQWYRVFVLLPLALALTSGWYTTAFLVVLLMDYMDHADGFVAKAFDDEGLSYDVPLTGFLDAFCDKVINVVALYTILVTRPWASTSFFMMFFMVFVVLVVSFYELGLAYIRLIDYFPSFPSNKNTWARYGGAGRLVIGYSMEAKIREKLLTFGIGFLCIGHHEGFNGMVYMALSLLVVACYLSHKSIKHKLFVKASTPEELDIQELEKAHFFSPVAQDESVDSGPAQTEYTTCYSVGCFDLQHDGHRILLENMRQYASRLVIGVHDDESIFRLKNRYPIDNTVRRIKNIKKYADVVYVIPGTDPTPYLDCMIDRRDADTSVYIRGNDMPQFPGRQLVERLLSIKLLPYTKGVSTTMLRKKLKERKRLNQQDNPWIRWNYQWIRADDEWIRYGDEWIRYGPRA